MNLTITRRPMATAQGPKKPNPPPNLHGHTVRGVSGDLYRAMCAELENHDGHPANARRAGGLEYLAIGPNVAVYPRTDPTPPPAPKRWTRFIPWAIGAIVLFPWALAVGAYAWAFYSLYAQAVIRFFL